MAEAPEGADAIRYDIALTSAHMAETTQELRRRVAGKKEQLARRVDVGEFAREHPWIALGIALGAGALLGGTGADRKAAKATAKAAKRTPEAAAELAKRAPAAAKGAALGLVHKARGRKGEADLEVETHEQERAMHHSGFIARVREHSTVFIEDLRAESESMAGGMTPGTAVGTFGAASPIHRGDGRA